MGSPAWWALPKSRGAGQGRRPPSTRASPLGPGSAKFGAIRQFLSVSTAKLVRSAAVPRPGVLPDGMRWTEAPRCPALSLAWNERRETRTAPSGTGSSGDRSGGGGVAGCTGGPALIVASGSPHWGQGCGNCLPGATEWFAPRPEALQASHRRAGVIAPGISESFQFLPTLGGNQETGVQVTLRGCRDFPETKKRMDNPPSLLVPEGKMRTPRSQLGAKGARGA